MSARISRQPRESGAPERLTARTSTDVSSLTAAGAEGVPPDSAPAGFVEGKARLGGAFWTPKRVAELRRLAAKGWSDGQIGAHFGGRKAGSILSVRNRYGVSPGRGVGSRVTNRSVSAAKPKPKAAKPKAAPKPKAEKPKAATKPKPKVAKAPKVKAPKPAAAPVPVAVVAPVVRVAPPPVPPVVVGVPMADLGARACRWPVGQDALGRHLFCGGGAVEGRPYCAEHHARSVKPRTESPS